MQGFDSLMAIGAAFGMELRELVQTFRIAEAKPLRSLVIRRAENLQRSDQQGASQWVVSHHAAPSAYRSAKNGPKNCWK